MSYPPRPSMYGRPEGQQYTQQQIQQQQQARNIQERRQFYAQYGHPEYGEKYEPFTIPTGYTVKALEETPEGLKIQFQKTQGTQAKFTPMHGYPLQEEIETQQVYSIQFYTEIGYSKYAGKYKPFEIPEPYRDLSRWRPQLSETPSGLQVSFRPTMRTIGEYAKLGIPVRYAFLGYPVPKIPEGYKIETMKQTGQGLQYTFAPVNVQQPSLTQQLADIKVPTLRSMLGIKTPSYVPEMFKPQETFRPFSTVAPLAIAPVESMVYSGMDIYSYVTGQQLTHPQYPPWTIAGAPEYTFFRVAGEVTLSYETSKAVQSLGSYVYEASGLKYSHFAYQVSQAKLGVETRIAELGFKRPEWTYSLEMNIRQSLGLGTGHLAPEIVSAPSSMLPSVNQPIGIFDIMATERFAPAGSYFWTKPFVKSTELWLSEAPAATSSLKSFVSDAWIRRVSGGLAFAAVEEEISRTTKPSLPFIPEVSRQPQTVLPKMASVMAILGISKLATPTIRSLTRSSVSLGSFAAISPIVGAVQMPRVATIQGLNLQTLQLQKLLQIPSGMGDLTFQMPRFDLPEDLGPKRKKRGKRRIRRRYGVGEVWYPQPPTQLFRNINKHMKGILR